MLTFSIPEQHDYYALKWFGDLDGDGNPDILMGVCGERRGCYDILLLNSKAKKGELIRAVSHYSWGFGC